MNLLQFQIEEKCAELGLRSLANEWNNVAETCLKKESSLGEFLLELLNVESVNRHVRAQEVLLKQAGFTALKTMEEFGLKRGDYDLKVYIMCEIPSNVILADEFCKLVDGFSIGSNDLTQLTLGLDRDSELVAHLYNENNL